MTLQERLVQTETKIQQTQEGLQQLEQIKQNMLQELLRLDGERRLILELQKDELAL
jgi:uncharacterized protein YbcI